MDFQGLFLFHQLVYLSPMQLPLCSEVAPAVDKDHWTLRHQPGASQIHWVVVVPEEEVALASASAMVRAEARPPDSVHPRIHNVLAIRHGRTAAAMRVGCSTSYSSSSAASCIASLLVD